MIRKFSFFKPVSRSPWLVAAITSIVPTGTSTAMLAPASGGFCWGGSGLGCTGGGPCCWPPCGPSGACPRALTAPIESVNAPAKISDKPLEQFAFMLDPSFYNHRRTYAGAATPRRLSGFQTLEIATVLRRMRQVPYPPHVTITLISLRAV